MSSKDCIADLFDLDEKLTQWYSNLDSSLIYTKRNLYQMLVVNEQHLYTLTHTMYHLCRLVLHTSLVPQFSGQHTFENMPVEVLSTCAKVGVKSAQAISDMCADLIALEWEPARIVPFFGYCAYVSASTLVVLLHSSDKSMAASARAKLRSNIVILKSMKCYWVSLERLVSCLLDLSTQLTSVQWQRIDTLCEAHSLDARSPSDMDEIWPKNALSQWPKNIASEAELIKNSNPAIVPRPPTLTKHASDPSHDRTQPPMVDFATSLPRAALSPFKPYGEFRPGLPTPTFEQFAGAGGTGLGTAEHMAGEWSCRHGHDRISRAGIAVLYSARGLKRLVAN
ncbi:hypothetical protein MRB53_040696 [Persea americana]|nr:hypothetical protein MRB53_040696 [Persea americana]